MKKVTLEQTMKPKTILCLALVLGGLRSNCFGATDTTQARLERMATNYSHFSLETVIKNRPLRLWGVMAGPQSGASGLVVRKPNPLVEEQTRLVHELRSVDGDSPALAALLKHPEPKVRTLALGAIFQREDGHDLPLIAGLIDDPALTFTNLHESWSSMGGPQPMSAVENVQTVGQVAREMLAFWGVPHDGGRWTWVMDTVSRRASPRMTLRVIGGNTTAVIIPRAGSQCG